MYIYEGKKVKRSRSISSVLKWLRGSLRSFRFSNPWCRGIKPFFDLCFEAASGNRRWSPHGPVAVLPLPCPSRLTSLVAARFDHALGADEVGTAPWRSWCLLTDWDRRFLAFLRLIVFCCRFFGSWLMRWMRWDISIESLFASLDNLGAVDLRWKMNRFWLKM